MEFNIYIINYYVLIPVFFIILFLSFLERRKSRRECCNGRPGLTIPFHFLDGYDNRTAYAMAFGTATSTVVSLIMSDNTLGFDFPLWGRVLYLYLQALRGCIICFPLFACLTTKYRAVGAILCIVYSALWLSLETVDVVKKVQDTVNVTFFDWEIEPDDIIGMNLYQSYQVLESVPILFCYLVLIGYCFYILHRCYQSKTYFSKRLDVTVKWHQEEHVRWVLRKFQVNNYQYSPSLLTANLNDNPLKKKFIHRMEESIRLRWLTNFPFFKYPTRIFALAFVQVCVLYWLGLLLIMGTIRLLQEIAALGDWIQTDVKIITIVCACVSLLVAICSALLQIFIGIRNYRYHMLKIYQGDMSFAPKVQRSPQYLLTRGMTFPGYQVAFTLWGQIVSFAVLLIFIWLIVYGLFILVKEDIFWTFVWYLAQLLSFPTVVIVVFYLQVYLAKAVLLQEKVNPLDKNPPLNVDNRKFYEIINYYALFANMTVGLFTCLWRIIKSAAYGIFTIGRLDRSVFTRDQEMNDKGFEAYIAMLLVENAHNNPCMRVFAHLLWTRILAARLQRKTENIMENVNDTATLTPNMGTRYQTYSTTLSRTETESSPSTPGSPGNPWTFLVIDDMKASKQVRNRWHLTYTLINNPDLCKVRKHKLMVNSRRSTLISDSLAIDSGTDVVDVVVRSPPSDSTA